MIGALLNLVTGGVAAYKQHNQNRAETLKRKDELESEKHQARVRRLQSGEEQASSLDEVSIRERGFKDEFILLVVFVPLILSFIPNYAPYVDAAAYPKSVLVCGGCRSRRHTRDARHGALSPRVLRLAMEGKMMGFLDTLIIAFMTGGVSSLGTIAALKTDINWIKRVQQDQEQRIRKLEIPNERTQVQRPSTKRPT